MSNTTAARQDVMEALFGADYYLMEERGTRYISEDDFAVFEDFSVMTDADWDFVVEMTFVDPMERDF